MCVYVKCDKVNVLSEYFIYFFLCVNINFEILGMCILFGVFIEVWKILKDLLGGNFKCWELEYIYYIKGLKGIVKDCKVIRSKEYK